jgi:NAD(P)-dependent dehydrogenase (short-subunit alcohol dehydrogenase family)
MNPFLCNGKRFLVTGAASGIGREASILLSSLGANLVLVDRNNNGLYETRSRCKDFAAIRVMDLLKDSVSELFADIEALDGLVHCAGKPYIAPLRAIRKEKCNEIWEINTWTAIELSQQFVKKFKKGSIVFISSDHALVGSGVNTGYAASKAALHGVTKTLAIELAPLVRVNCIAPGFIKTPMADEITPMFREGYIESVTKLYPLGLGEPEDVACAIAYLLSDASRWITGTVLIVDGGYTAQ